MPSHGIFHDDVDAVLPLSKIGPALIQLAHGNGLPAEADEIGEQWGSLVTAAASRGS